jgi:hypothetical protein
MSSYYIYTTNNKTDILKHDKNDDMVYFAIFCSRFGQLRNMKSGEGYISKSPAAKLIPRDFLSRRILFGGKVEFFRCKYRKKKKVTKMIQITFSYLIC